LKWEYWNGTKWEQLSLNDYTDHFHQSGFIEFITPEDMQLKEEFNRKLCWIRLIFESGSFEVDPKIVAIHLNSIYAFNEQSHNNELIGSSNARPSQEFKILHDPVLPGIELYVKETELPPANERELIIGEEGKDAIMIKKDSDEKEEYWIRYHEVENFYSSTPQSRHYLVNYLRGTITFGDGSRGMIPPRVANNIKILRYKTGGGNQGNVGSNTINILRENIPYINGVNNFYSAEGGSDLEDLERLKSRATNIFKNFNRAVTAEDYEWLAKEASTSIGRAKCLPNVGKNGEVILIVVPEIDAGDINLKEKILPTAELLRRVKEFIDLRKMVGTKLRVEAPIYKNISINIKLVFKKNISEVQILKDRVELLIRRFFHSLKGGHIGNGWPFGMPMTKNEVFRALEKHDGISYLEEITIIDDDIEAEIEKVILPDDGLIYINQVNIIEREYQY
jgi:predicted phage baseplate assembly protein